MSKKNLDPTPCTIDYAVKIAENYIGATHRMLAMQERDAGKKLFTTFGEWKEEHPDHPRAKMLFPDDEYVEVINNYYPYFAKKYAVVVLSI